MDWFAFPRRRLLPCWLLAVYLTLPAGTSSPLLAQGGARHKLFGDLHFVDKLDTQHRIQGLKVMLKSLSGQILRQQPVGIEGRYQFMDIPNGDYVLVIEANGEEMVHIEMLIQEYRSTDIRKDLELTWKPAVQAPPVKVRDGRAVYARSPQNQTLFEQAQVEFEKSPELAELSLKNLVAGDPDDYEVWTELGSAEFKQQRYQEARKSYRKALSLYNDYLPALLNLGKLEIASKEYDQAIEVLDRATRLAPEMGDAHYYLGEALLQTKKGSRAVSHFEKALDLEPLNLAEAHLRIASLYRAAGYPQLAAEEYRKYLEKRPGSPQREALENFIKSVP